MLQRQHPNFSIVEETCDSDAEFQPTVLDESTSSESEGEEQLSVARTHPSKGCAPLHHSFAQLTRSPAASSGMLNPGCTPLNTSTKPGHKRSSTVVNAQPRQLPSTSLGNSSSLNVNPRQHLFPIFQLLLILVRHHQTLLVLITQRLIPPTLVINYFLYTLIILPHD